MWHFRNVAFHVSARDTFGARPVALILFVEINSIVRAVM